MLPRRDGNYVCGDEERVMFQRILLALSITLSLYLFWGIRLQPNTSRVERQTYFAELTSFAYLHKNLVKGN